MSSFPPFPPYMRNIQHSTVNYHMKFDRPHFLDAVRWVCSLGRNQRVEFIKFVETEPVTLTVQYYPNQPLVLLVTLVMTPEEEIALNELRGSFRLNSVYTGDAEGSLRRLSNQGPVRRFYQFQRSRARLVWDLCDRDILYDDSNWPTVVPSFIEGADRPVQLLTTGTDTLRYIARTRPDLVVRVHTPVMNKEVFGVVERTMPNGSYTVDHFPYLLKGQGGRWLRVMMLLLACTYREGGGVLSRDLIRMVASTT